VDILGNGVCIHKCPLENIFQPSNRSQLICKDHQDLTGMLGCSFEGKIVEDVNQLVVCGGCMFQADSFAAMDFCIPKVIPVLLQQVDYAANATGFDPLHQLYVPHLVPFMEKFVTDIWTARHVVLGLGLAGSLVLGFLFLLILRMPGFASILVWGAAIVTPVSFVFGGIYCRQLLTVHEQRGDDRYMKFFQFLSYLFYFIAAIIACVLVFLRRRIMLAISITKVAAKSVMAFPLSIFYPFFQLFGYLLLVLPWTVFMMFLAGTGKHVEKTQEIFSYEISYTSYEYTPNVKLSFWFMLFILFWTSAYIVAIGQITLAMCYSKWYFSENKKNRVGIESSLLSCMFLSFIYHNGTAAFGSMILGATRFTRAILLWVQKK